MAVNVNVDDVALRAVVSKAVIDELTQEKKDELLQKAIESILRPTGKSDRYPYEPLPSPLEIAFQAVVENVALEKAREALSKDEEFAAKLRKLLTDVVDKVFADQDAYEGLVNSLAADFSRAISEHRRRL